MSFVQTRLSPAPAFAFTPSSTLSSLLFIPIATSPLHLHFPSLHCTSLHCTSCCNIAAACATIIPTDIQTISSIPDGPPTTDSTTGLRAIPTPRSALREQLRFRRYRPAPRGTSCDPGSCIFDNHRALEQSPFTPHCKPPFSSPPRLLLLLCSLFTISLSPHSKPRSACHPRF